MEESIPSDIHGDLLDSVIISKVLTISDVLCRFPKTGRFTLPRSAVERNFPFALGGQRIQVVRVGQA